MMRHCYLGILLLFNFPILSFGGGQGLHIATSGINSISSAYIISQTTMVSGPQMTLVNPTAKHFFISNGCTIALAVTFTNSTAAVAPSSSTTLNPQQIFIGAGTTSAVTASQFNFLGAAKYVWVRTDSSATVSQCQVGDVTLDAW